MLTKGGWMGIFWEKVNTFMGPLSLKVSLCALWQIHQKNIGMDQTPPPPFNPNPCPSWQCQDFEKPPSHLCCFLCLKCALPAIETTWKDIGNCLSGDFLLFGRCFFIWLFGRWWTRDISPASRATECSAGCTGGQIILIITECYWLIIIITGWPIIITIDN